MRFIPLSSRRRFYSMRQELLFKNYKDRHYCIFEAGSGGNGAMHFHRDKMIGRLIDSSSMMFEIYYI